MESTTDIEDSVALEAAAWSGKTVETGGVGEGNLATSSPVTASLSLDELETSWLVSGFWAEVLTKLC
jgi:hypothetical protein